MFKSKDFVVATIAALVVGCLLLVLAAPYAINLWSQLQPEPTVSDKLPAFGPLPEITLTPGPGGNPLPTLAAALPTPRFDNKLGDEKAYIGALMAYNISQSFDNRVPGTFSSSGAALCESNLRVLDTEMIMPWSQYGDLEINWTTLYGAVDSRSLTPENFIVTGVLTETVMVSEFPPVYEIRNSADLEVHLKMGLLEPGRMPGGSFSYASQEPFVLYTAVVEPFRILFFDDPLVVRMRDRTNNVATREAEMNGIAPKLPEGGRSTWKLERLWESTNISLTTPSGDPEKPHAYDNLLKEADAFARAAGYQKLNKLTVILEKPTEWIYIEDGTSVLADPPYIEGEDQVTCVIPDKAFFESLPAEWLFKLPPEVLAEIMTNP